MPRLVSVISPVLALVLTAFAFGSDDDLDKDRRKRPASTPPELEIVDSSAGSFKAIVRSDWQVPLESALESDGPLSAAEVIARSTAGLDIASETFELPRVGRAPFAVLGSSFEEVSLAHLPDDVLDALAIELPATPVRVVGEGVSANRPVATLDARLLTFDRSTVTLRRYSHVETEVRLDATSTSPSTTAAQTSPHMAVETSVLSDGTWFKFPVTREGVYRIDAEYLTSLGVSPQGVDPARLRIFGNGGLPLPQVNSDPRPVDLVEQPVFVSHDGDAVFEAGEFVIFFATGPQQWSYDDVSDDWTHVTHPFSNSNYYFIQTDGPPGKRIAALPWPGFTSPVVATEFEARHVVDDDRIHLEQDGSGSGLEWFGLLVDREVTRRTVLEMEPANLASGPIRYRARIAVRSNPAATIQFESRGTALADATPGIVNLGANNPTAAMARAAAFNFDQPGPPDGRIDLDMRLIGTVNDPSGWLDWVRVFYPARLQAEQGVLRFTSPLRQTGTFEFRLTGFSSEPQVWDVTDLGEFVRLPVQQSGSEWAVQVETFDEAPREFVAFNSGAAGVQTPDPGQPVSNQDLHGRGDYPDFVIVVPSAFRSVADRLAARRRAEGLVVSVTDIDEIHNEFSGGVPDMRAVRDYFRFLYDRGREGDREFRYALLMGDGHYDFRSLTDDADSPLNPNWIFPYQTDNTLVRGSSYTSDDYFGLLDPDEGEWRWLGDRNVSFERVDIGIGRWPVENLEEAELLLSKLEMYESQETQGAWRTRYMFVADDGPAGSSEDGDLHTQNADVVAEAVVGLYPEMNTDKVYAISYPSVTTSNGRRVPEANRDIVRNLEDGVLVWNYSGHGGVEGLADERIFTKEDILALDTGDKMSLFVTATCTFGRFDTEREKSGAEDLLLKEVGGSVALFTTVRVVVTWVNPNTYNLGLNLELNRHLLRREESGKGLRLGDVIRITKNSNVGLQGNNRKFNLLGDPTMRLALPERTASVTAVNGSPVDSTGIKLRALERVRLDGRVGYQDGTADPSFDGIVEVTVFDAKRAVEIPEEEQRHIPSGTYTVQNDLIYRGKVEASAGEFSAEFVVPRDIAFSDLPGRISMYASSADIDGFGATENVLVGGTADTPVNDAEGPEIELFLNDTTFVSGGLTTTEPLLIVQLNDESGINTVGTGVGHEMLLVIDGDEQNAIEIGERFEGTLGSFQKGTVTFRLPIQTAGEHTLSVRAWDVVNNSSEQAIEYVVTAGEDLAIENVFNYPNPMANSTRFVFEHNQPPGTPADIELRLYTISGRLIQIMDGVDTLPAGVLPGGPVQIPWDGLDEDLDRVSPGVYLYRVRVTVDLPSGGQDSAEHLGRLAVVG